MSAQVTTQGSTSRSADEELAQRELRALKAQHASAGSPTLVAREIEDAEDLELPGTDMSDESVALDVLPRQLDEFTCSKCFLVHHRSQLDHEGTHGPVCSDCS